jgi:hypothetical protein
MTRFHDIDQGMPRIQVSDQFRLIRLTRGLDDIVDGAIRARTGVEFVVEAQQSQHCFSFGHGHSRAYRHAQRAPLSIGAIPKMAITQGLGYPKTYSGLAKTSGKAAAGQLNRTGSQGQSNSRVP